MKHLMISALGLMVALAAGAGRINSSKPADATSEAGISPYEVQLQIDPHSLPEEKISDLI